MTTQPPRERGRPALPESEQKAKINITIDKDVLDWIDEQLVAKRKRSQIINKLLKEAKERN